MSTQKPSVSRMVHYVSYGTPGGEYSKECRAAVVTEVDPDDAEHVGLCVLNPSGIFMRTLAQGGCGIDTSSTPGGGTWHWPERVE